MPVEQDCETPLSRPSRLINRWARLIWISAAAGSLPAVLQAIFGNSSPRRFLDQASYGFIYAACIGILCTLVLPRIASRVLRMRPVQKWPALLAVLIVLAAAGCFAASLVLLLFGVVRPGQFYAEYWQSLKLSVLVTFAFGLSAFFHDVIVSRYNQATSDLKASDEAAKQLRQIATEARLSSLESRVQPHFLFNTLNSVLALIREDPAAAERMVERLAALLRFSLDANQSRFVPLSLEAKIIRDYLEIEQARFGSRLRFSIDIPKPLESLPVPPMSLQTLVENSVKYAVSSRREGATILLRATQQHGSARIQVLDDGPGFPTSRSKPGHGLELLEDRVAGLYNGQGDVEIANAPFGGASVTLILPLAAEPALPRETLSQVAQ